MLQRSLWGSWGDVDVPAAERAWQLAARSAPWGRLVEGQATGWRVTGEAEPGRKQTDRQEVPASGAAGGTRPMDVRVQNGQWQGKLTRPMAGEPLAGLPPVLGQHGSAGVYPSAGTPPSPHSKPDPSSLRGRLMSGYVLCLLCEACK
jgi:hypothetical protein